MCLLLINGCSTEKPTLDQIVHNPHSMTQTLKALNSNFLVQVLASGMDNSNYVRISILKLNNVPVVAAVSQTNANNKTFVSILANAHNNSIGNKLFAANSAIGREDGMRIRNILVKNIPNSTIASYLLNLGYASNQTIISRQSRFYYNSETLDIVEYILPTIGQYL